MGERSYFQHVENANAHRVLGLARGRMNATMSSAIALIDLTYLDVLFNFTHLYRSFVQNALGVAQWESQPTAPVTLGGSRHMVSVRAWKRNGDVQRLLVAGRRDASN